VFRIWHDEPDGPGTASFCALSAGKVAVHRGRLIEGVTECAGVIAVHQVKCEDMIVEVASLLATCE
jgi:hypothetical protein